MVPACSPPVPPTSAPQPYHLLQVRLTLAHLECVYLDEPVWDLAAPRTHCDAYASSICNELGLDWQAHALITRRMKDAVDAATKVGMGW